MLQNCKKQEFKTSEHVPYCRRFILYDVSGITVKVYNEVSQTEVIRNTQAGGFDSK